MWSRSVTEWLRELRRDVEYYDAVPVPPLRFGRVCSVSVVFSEGADRLTVAPVVYETLDGHLDGDVADWRRRLRHACCPEEENLLEAEDLITEFSDESKESEDSSNKPGHFPVHDDDKDEGILLRTGKIHKPPQRPKTVASTTTKKKDDQCELELAADKTAVPSDERSAAWRRFRPAGPWNQLLRLLKKRSSRDLLESKGILRNEPIFGNVLRDLVDAARPVPEVVTRLVGLIEGPANVTSVGLYRASGNMAVIQHIRCEIDCGRWDVLDKYREEVDVLAGTLKLFFRELKEPLVPYEFFQRLKSLEGMSSPTEKSEAEINTEIRDIVDGLPAPNRATFLYIIRHLLEVHKHREANKMDLHNIAICWGPSLITYPLTCHDLVSHTAELSALTERLLECYMDVSEEQHVAGPTFDGDFAYQVVDRITRLVDAHLDTEGIYRKSGSNTRIDKILRILNGGDFRSLDEIDNYKTKSDVHDLCCVLKRFLGSLKEPLIPDDFLDRYHNVCDTLKGLSLEEGFGGMIDEFPQKHILLLLMRHLRRVIQHEKTNKMSMTIMADIWMTTLVSHKTVQADKKRLFQDLLNLDDQVLPDLLPETESFQRKGRESKYDNVDDNYGDVSCKNVYTKL